MIKAWTAFWAARKRRQEKARRSQNLESTFPQRLARRNTSPRRTSKIDVGTSHPNLNSDPEFTSQSNLNSDPGFTSQPNLNSDPENSKRRPTFSRFLQLWKSIRNSKRKSNSEENRRSVVFTIPTEDIFPKSETKQQTQRVCSEDHHRVADVNGFVTHLCDVHSHRENTDDEWKQNKLNHPNNNIRNSKFYHQVKRAPTSNENERMFVEMTVNQDGQIESKSTPPNAVNEEETTSNVFSGSMHTLENGDSLDEDKRFTKESDLENDSGCGSSCHEISSTESPVAYVCLNVKSLGVQTGNVISAQDSIDKKEGFSSYFGPHSRQNRQLTIPEECNASSEVLPCETKQDPSDLGGSQESFKTTQVVGNSFETLIQLAELGMSGKAHENGENVEKEEVRTGNKTLSFAKEADKAGDSFEGLNDSKVGTNNYIEHMVNYGVQNTRIKNNSTECNTDYGLITSTSAHPVELGYRLSSSHSLTTADNEKKDASLVRKTDQLNEEKCKNTNDQFNTKRLQFKKHKQVSFESCTKHSSATLNEMNLKKSSGSCQGIEERQYKETFLSVENLTTHHEQGSVINASPSGHSMDYIDGGQGGKAAERTSVTNLRNFKIPSLETLQVPSQTVSDDGKRIRSFSATMRRKFSFRGERQTTDKNLQSSECDGTKTKKLKGFRSFRMNKKSKTGSGSDIRNRTNESSETKGYRSTFDKIFSENTGSELFTDIPFTIPENCD